MKPYLAQIRSNLRLMARDRSVLFFSVLFPLTFFFLFAQAFDAAKSPGAMSQVLASVIIIGVLGNGFMGAGIRTVQDRETNVLRRFKVAPTNAGPVIVASVVAGLVNFLPVILLFFFFGRVLYRVPIPGNLAQILIFASVGIISFRSLGMIIASVVNSAQEGNIVIQLLYLPMLFLSGATFPLAYMPKWVQRIAQFLPATYLYSGVQSLIISGESLLTNTFAVGALLLTAALSIFIGIKLFRWEKEEKISGTAKLWLLAVLAPFFLLGLYQFKSDEALTKTKLLAREARRRENLLFTNVRIITEAGPVIENGALLVRNGRIEQVFPKSPADVKALNASVVDSSGKVIVPGLIDMHVHLGSPGGVYRNSSRYADPKAQERRLAAYLYSGIVAVRSTGDLLDGTLKLRSQEQQGSFDGAELFTCGPLFTAPGGHPTELLRYMPPGAVDQFVRLPKSASEARRQVDQLAERKVNCIKSVLEGGNEAWGKFNELPPDLYRAIVSEAHQQHLAAVTHTGSAQDVAEAVEAGTNTVEHGASVDAISSETFAAMREKGIAYDPTLSVYEGAAASQAGQTSLLDRPLLRQAAPADLLADTRQSIKPSSSERKREAFAGMLMWETRNLQAAYKAGVTLIAGSDAGNPLVIHGPTVQHEMALWVKAGVPPTAALQAATVNAARALGIADRLGSLAPGKDASFLIVEGDPLSDISSLEHIATVVYKGERLRRSELLEQDKQ